MPRPNKREDRGYDPHPEKQVLKRPVVFIPAKKLVVPPAEANYIEGADWWLVRSEHSQKQLERMFANGDVGCVLYERIGAYEQLEKIKKQYLLSMQIVCYNDLCWDVDWALEDAGIYIEGPHER